MKTKIAMKEELLRVFSKRFLKFTKIITEASDDYSFYRGKIYSDSEGLVHIDFLLADIEGVFKQKGLAYNDATGDIFYDKKFSLKGDAKIAAAIHELLVFLSELPKPISTVYFEIYSTYRIGKMFLDPKEPGSYIVYLLSGHSQNEDPSNEEYSYAITGRSELMKNWNKI